jgi:hypothetical protein
MCVRMHKHLSLSLSLSLSLLSLSHTHTHTMLTCCSQKEMEDQLLSCQRQIVALEKELAEQSV